MKIFEPTHRISGSRAVNESLTHYLNRVGVVWVVKRLLFNPKQKGILYTRRYGIIYILQGIGAIYLGIKQIILGRQKV
jgi:hypothetical protein